MARRQQLFPFLRFCVHQEVGYLRDSNQDKVHPHRKQLKSGLRTSVFGVWVLGTNLQAPDQLPFLATYYGFPIRNILPSNFPPDLGEASLSVSLSDVSLFDSTVINLNKSPNTKIRQICLIF